jgi:hypothetical protein
VATKHKSVRMARIQMDDAKWAEIQQYGIRKRKNQHTLLGQMLERGIDQLLREERQERRQGASA